MKREQYYNRRMDTEMTNTMTTEKLLKKGTFFLSPMYHSFYSDNIFLYGLEFSVKTEIQKSTVLSHFIEQQV